MFVSWAVGAQITLQVSAIFCNASAKTRLSQPAGPAAGLAAATPYFSRASFCATYLCGFLWRSRCGWCAAAAGTSRGRATATWNTRAARRAWSAWPTSAAWPTCRRRSSAWPPRGRAAVRAPVLSTALATLDQGPGVLALWEGFAGLCQAAPLLDLAGTGDVCWLVEFVCLCLGVLQEMRGRRAARGGC